MRGKIFALFVVFVLFLEVFAFAGALSVGEESSTTDYYNPSSYSSSTSSYSSSDSGSDSSSYSSSSSSLLSYSDSSTSDYFGSSSSSSYSDSSTSSTSAYLPSYDLYGSPLSSVNGEDCRVEGCLNGGECNYETGVCGEIESNSDNIVGDKEKKDLKASDRSLAKKALDFATEPVGPLKKVEEGANAAAEASKKMAQEEIDKINERLKDPNIGFLEKMNLLNRLNALQESQGNANLGAGLIGAVLPTKLDLTTLGIGGIFSKGLGLVAKGAGWLGKLTDGLKGLFGASKAVDAGVKAAEGGVEAAAKTMEVAPKVVEASGEAANAGAKAVTGVPKAAEGGVEAAANVPKPAVEVPKVEASGEAANAGAKAVTGVPKAAEGGVEAAANAARRQLQGEVDAAKKMLEEAKTPAEREYAEQSLKEAEDALKKVEPHAPAAPAPEPPVSTPKIVLNEAQQILKNGRVITNSGELQALARRAGLVLEEGGIHIKVKNSLGRLVTTIPRGKNVNPNTAKDIVKQIAANWQR